jgi:hypothetical protein
MGLVEVAATRTAISMARWPGRRCSGDEDDDDAPAAVLLAGGDDDIAGVRVSGARDAAGELLVSWRRGGRAGGCVAMRMLADFFWLEFILVENGLNTL